MKWHQLATRTSTLGASAISTDTGANGLELQESYRFLPRIAIARLVDWRNPPL
jgi:hypothetical protein